MTSIIPPKRKADVGTFIGQIAAHLFPDFAHSDILFNVRERNRIFTRGDGYRYKDPSYISADHETVELMNNTLGSGFTTVFITEILWEYLITMRSGKPVLVGEEFGHKSNIGVKVGRMTFVMSPEWNFIHYTPSSNIKNSVWERKQPERDLTQELMQTKSNWLIPGDNGIGEQLLINT